MMINIFYKHKNRLPLGSLFLFLLLIVSSCRTSPADHATVQANDVTSSVSYPFAASDNKVKQISAHRGGGDISGYPENCLESIKYIDEQVGAWMEIDIRETKDGQLILMHDASLDRTTSGFGKVASKAYDEIKQLTLKDNEGRMTDYHPPLLRDVLEWNEREGKTVLNLDIKQDVDYKDVLRLVKETNQMDNVIAIVYTLGQAKAMRRLNDDIVISLPVRNLQEWERLSNSDLPIKNLIAFTGTIRSDKKLYDILHTEGLLTIFGTMGNIDRQAAARGPKVYEQLYDDGADILSTDRPLEVTK